MAAPLLNDTWLAVNKKVNYSNFRNENLFMVVTFILKATIMDFAHLELT